MVAPPEAYSSKSLFIGSCEHLLAKVNPNYATMKSRFFLDEVLGTQTGIVGLVNPDGPNASMHNLTTRRGVGRVGNYVFLNDGGLNCLSQITAFSMPDEMGNLTGETNNITFVSAYYNGSSASQYGVKYNESADPGWKTVFADEDLPANTTLTRKFTIPPMLPNQSVEFKAFIINSEGEVESASQVVLVLNEAIMMSYSDVGPSFGLCATFKDTAIYTGVDEIEIGTFFFTNAVLTVPAPAGGYSDGTNYYGYDATFGVNLIESCATPPTRPSLTYTSFMESSFLACSLDDTGGNIYYEVSGFDIIWFTSADTGITTKAPAGFYGYYNESVKKVIEVGSDGLQLSDNVC